MKTYYETARDLLDRRDRYLEQRKKKRKTLIQIFSVVIAVCASLMILSGILSRHDGNAVVRAANLLEGIRPSEITQVYDMNGPGVAAMMDFAVSLLKEEGKKGGNVLISPLSALYSLGMMANGADGSTRSQMEEVIGMKTDDLNLALYTFRKALSEEEKKHLIQANSIVFSDGRGYQVNMNFLQTCADYYQADLYQTPFDNNMVREVNEWVADRTSQKITEILEEVPEESVAYIINALSFEARWENECDKEKMRKGRFRLDNGETKTVTYLTFQEDQYLYGKEETGFIKYYQADSGRQYAFMAILPRYGTKMVDYLSKLSGSCLHDCISETDYICDRKKFRISIPRFTVTYESDLSESLKALGMTEAFDGDQADFSSLGSFSHRKKSVPFIGQFIHKTTLSIDGKGTKARAASAIAFELEEEIADDYASVNLSRPFIYVIFDCKTKLPVFLGICNEPVE